MTIVGMGVTFLTLFALALIIRLLSKLFPYVEEKEREDSSVEIKE